MKILGLISLLLFSQLAFGEYVGQSFQKVLNQQAALATNPSWPGFSYARVDTSCVKPPLGVTLEKFALIRITPQLKGHFNFGLDHKEIMSDLWTAK